jgi:plasmid maintenance system antidote protein VapI
LASRQEPVPLEKPQGRRTGPALQAGSSILNGRSGVTAEMALRLSKAFGSTPEHWLQMQLAYDLWQARHRAKKLHVKQFFATAPG